MKKLLLASLAAMLAGGLAAGTLTPEQALARLSNSGASKRIVSATTAPVLQQKVGDLFLFKSGTGFMVLPATDAAPALLAYSDKGDLSLDNPGVAYWLDFYNRQLETLGADAPAYLSSEWRTPRAPIAPLIKTKWNQETPYNDLCPEYGGHKCVTGCVATAMAQQMKYYNYPVHGKGTHSYRWAGGLDLSFDYENTEFQWDLMTDTYGPSSTEEERRAVADLMYACGVSVDMNYSPVSSGAASVVMGTSFIDIFDYSPAIWMPNRDYYGYDEWESLIYESLAQRVPVPYDGRGTAGGHQFICDGYDEGGYFHFNWGWGGLSDGYFLLTALNPDNLGVGGGAGGFNMGQSVALNVRPPEEGDKKHYLLYDTKEFLCDKPTAEAGEYVSFPGAYQNFSMEALPAGSKLQIRIINKEGGEPMYLVNLNVSGLPVYSYYSNMRLRFPELHDGVYEISPVLDIEGEKYEVRSPLGTSGIVIATVLDGKATFTGEELATIKVSDIRFPEKVFFGAPFPISFAATNDTDLEFYSHVTPYLLDEAGEAVAESVYRPLDVLPLQTEMVENYHAEFKALEGKSFGVGEYKLVFRSTDGKDVSHPVVINLEELPEHSTTVVKDFKLDGINPVTDPEKVKFTYTFECTEGYFYGHTELWIFPGNGGYALDSKSGSEFYVVEGGIHYGVIDMNLAGLEDGKYMCTLYCDGVRKTDYLVFDIKRSQTGVEVIVTDSERPVIFDMTGRPVEKICSPGLYIINGQKVIVNQ